MSSIDIEQYSQDQYRSFSYNRTDYEKFLVFIHEAERCVIAMLRQLALNGLDLAKRGLIYAFLSLLTQILKFCIVLMLTYGIALGIFYFWIEIMQQGQEGIRLQTKMPIIEKTILSGHNNPTTAATSHGMEPYPKENLVEIPSKLSVDGERPKRRSKERSSLVEREDNEAVEQAYPQNSRDTSDQDGRK